jgi:hypothetical protein
MKSETFETGVKEISEDMIVAEMLKYDIVIHLPPVREYPIKIKVEKSGEGNSTRSGARGHLMAKDYPWYEIVEGDEPLLQGDFISECPIIVPPSELITGAREVNTRVVAYNVVVMSQSCDLVQGKLDLVLVCPIWPLSEFEKTSEYYKSKIKKEKRRYAAAIYRVTICSINAR